MVNHEGRVTRAAMQGWRMAVVCVAAAGVSTCSTDGAFFISDEEEIAVGLEVDKQIRQEYVVCGPGTCPQELLAWVDGLGQSLAAKSDRADIEYTFTVLHSDIINAFAAPGGFIYVTTGLLRNATTISEVAGVLSHEVGHVVERHGAEQMEAELGLTLLEQLVLGNESAISDAANILYGTYAGFVQSKDKELEADAQGVIISARANHSPNGLISFFQTLQQLFGDPDAISDILSSHPSPVDRIAHAKDVIADEKIDADSLPDDGNPPYSTILAMLPPPAGDAE